MKKSCGTCAHWAEEDFGGYRQCEWQLSTPLPFWATLNRGSDHEDSTSAEQGTRCLTWQSATAATAPPSPAELRQFLKGHSPHGCVPEYVLAELGRHGFSKEQVVESIQQALERGEVFLNPRGRLALTSLQ